VSTLTNCCASRTTVLLKSGLLALLATGFCTGGSCTINIDHPGDPGAVAGYVPLDEAFLDLRINASGGTAEATAVITDLLHRIVRLRQGQEVAINGRSLIGPDVAGVYRATLSAAGEYTVTVREPTRGVSNTLLQPPPGFSIVQPPAGGTASLSGFTVAWTNSDPALDVEIRLTQVLFGAERTVTFGPFTDTGTQALSASQLADFRQGAPLLVTVIRILESPAVEGFRSAVASVEISETVSVTPTP
jgi:hypothetical protein